MDNLQLTRTLGYIDTFDAAIGIGVEPRLQRDPRVQILEERVFKY